MLKSRLITCIWGGVMIFESPILSSYKRKCKHAEQTVKSLDSVLNINSLWATYTKKGNL